MRFLSIIALFAYVTHAVPESEDSVCFESCRSALLPLRFDDAPADQAGICHSLKAIASLYLCLGIYCEESARSVGLDPLNRTCDEALPSFDLVANYTRADLDDVTRVELNQTKKVDPFTQVIVPSEAYFGVWWDTLVSIKLFKTTSNIV